MNKDEIIKMMEDDEEEYEKNIRASKFLMSLIENDCKEARQEERQRIKVEWDKHKKLIFKTKFLVNREYAIKHFEKVFEK